MALLLWVTDPWESLDHANDTTLRLAQEAVVLGHTSLWADVHSVCCRGGEVTVDAYPLSSAGNRLDEHRRTNVSELDAVHYRVDPPVAPAYTLPLQLFASAVVKNVEFINPIVTLLATSEKVPPGDLVDVMPPTLATSDVGQLTRFVQEYGRCVVKPLNDAQSRGVQEVEDDSLLHSRLAAATRQFSVPITVQKYLPEIADGEVRLWYVDGELIATAKKYPVAGDFRVDIDRGSRVGAYTLTPAESETAAKIGVALRSGGTRLAAVDLIGGYLTDFNVTSPGLLRQMEAAIKTNLAREVIRRLHA